MVKSGTKNYNTRMRVLILNGSPHAGGNTAIALREMEGIFSAEGIETETVRVWHENIRGCVACLSCQKSGEYPRILSAGTFSLEAVP